MSLRLLVLLLHFQQLCQRCLAVNLFTAKKEPSLYLDIYDTDEKCPRTVEDGHYLSVQYVGKIHEDSRAGWPGQVFYSTWDSYEVFQFQIGRNQVIKAIEEQFPGLCQGAKVMLTVPPSHGYGYDESKINMKGVPAGATLLYDLTLVNISHWRYKKDPKLKGLTVFQKMDSDGDGKISRPEVKSYLKTQWREDVDATMHKEDKDRDGYIQWEEFSGPKGDSPPAKKEEKEEFSGPKGDSPPAKKEEKEEL